MKQAVLDGDYAGDTEEMRKAIKDISKAELASKKIEERTVLILQLLSDEDAEGDCASLKAILSNLKEKEEEARKVKEEAELKLSNPKIIDRVITAASKAVACQLEKLSRIERLSNLTELLETRRSLFPRGFGSGLVLT